MLTNNFEELSAIFPVYTPTGEQTKLFFRTGRTEQAAKKIHAYLQNMASFYTFDLIALRNQSGKRTGHSHLLPLPFSPCLLLFPVKVRRPRVIGDFTMGYINKYAIEKIEPSSNAPYRTKIFLSGGHQLYSLWTAATIRQNMLRASLSLVVSDEACQLARFTQQCIELLRTFKSL